MTMVPIRSVVISQPSSNVIINSIPQTYAHLHLRIYERSFNAAAFDAMYIYGIDGTGNGINCAFHQYFGTNNAVGTNGQTAQFYYQPGFIPARNTLGGVYAAGIVDILDYSSTTKKKTFRSIWGYNDNGSTSGTPFLGYTSGYSEGLGTSAMTSISFAVNSGFEPGTRFDLYGITTSGLSGA